MNETESVPESSVVFLDAELNPVPKEKAVLVKAWIDGVPVFLKPEEKTP